MPNFPIKCPLCYSHIIERTPSNSYHCSSSGWVGNHYKIITYHNKTPHTFHIKLTDELSVEWNWYPPVGSMPHHQACFIIINSIVITGNYLSVDAIEVPWMEPPVIIEDKEKYLNKIKTYLTFS